MIPWPELRESLWPLALFHGQGIKLGSVLNEVGQFYIFRSSASLLLWIDLLNLTIAIKERSYSLERNKLNNKLGTSVRSTYDGTSRERKRAGYMWLAGAFLFGRAVNGPCCCGVIFDARRHVCHRPELHVLLPKHTIYA